MLFLSTLSLPSYAEDKHNRTLTQSTSVTAADPLFDLGLVLDETISKPGADFYQFFFQHWQPITKNSPSIRIKDQPGFLRDHFILVWLNDELVFRQRLPFRADEIESVAKKAAQQLNAKLLENLFIQTQLDH